MDNFRGFRDTVIPLKQITFLVGENSTGKSSFLKLLYMLSRPQFYFSPEHSIQEEVDLGSFDDIVSAWSDDRSFFKVGTITSEKDIKTNRLTCSFTVFTFSNRDGSPFVARYIQFSAERLTKLAFQPRRTKYKTIDVNETFNNENDILQFFRNVVEKDQQDTEGFTFFPKNIPPNPPLVVAVAILKTIAKGKTFHGYEFTAEIPFSIDLTWIAPIRTKPLRFYDGMRKAFTPEGDHTPFILRKSLRAKTKSRIFAAKLKAFGESSGMFDTIIPHSFDRSPQSPFEILVKFSAAQLNINNVGYGVSQVLPLIVEFLSREKNRTFAVQQPEVHLHPRAQASLGDIVAELAKERKHWFILETHSDYLIDRCRLNLAKSAESPSAQVIFFQRTQAGNKATVLDISNGKYPSDQPVEFRNFFVREEMSLLEI
jgi:hypothetical protein